MINPLPLFTPLYPNESLNSYLLRLTRLNCYQSVDVIIDLVRVHAGYNLGARFPTLSQITTATSEDLYLSSHHRAAEYVTNLGERLDEIEIDGIKRNLMSSYTYNYNGRPYEKSVFCPLCLTDNCYHRLHWQSKLTSVCLDHNCLLLPACPICGSNISIDAIVSGECSECYYNLKKAPVAIVEFDTLVYGFQSLIQSWWGYQSDPNLIKELRLPNFSMRMLSSLLAGFKKSIQLLGRDFRFYHGVKLEGNLDRIQDEKFDSEFQNLELSATACKIISWWPMGFHKFLRAYFESIDNHRTSLSDKELGNFLEFIQFGRGSTRDFSFVNREVYLLASFSTDFKENFRRIVIEKYFTFEHNLIIKGGIDIAENILAAQKKSTSARKLDMSRHVVPSATHDESKRDKRDSGNKQNQFEGLLMTPEVGVDIDYAALELGTSPNVVHELVSLGFLTLIDETVYDVRNQKIDRRSINKFIYGMFGIAGRRTREMMSCTPINEAVQILSDYGITKAGLIGMINNGWILTRWKNDSIEGIEVSSQDLAQLKCRLDEGRQFYTIEEIADIRRVPLEVVGEWIEQELLISFLDNSGTYYVIGSDLHDFYISYVDWQEACIISGVDSFDLQRWVVDTLITPVYTGVQEGSFYYLFKRIDLQRFSLEMRQSPYLFKQTYGVSLHQVKLWIRKGQIEFLSPSHSRIKKEIPLIRMGKQQKKNVG